MLDWEDNKQPQLNTATRAGDAAAVHHPDPFAVDAVEGAGATGAESIAMGAGRIQVDDKKIINCKADLNQLVPFKYGWAWEKYIAGCANHWMPNEINMSADIGQWKNPPAFSDDERLIGRRGEGLGPKHPQLQKIRLCTSSRWKKYCNKIKTKLNQN